MTTLNYILCAVSKLPSGQTPVHMYIGVTDPTGTDSPGDERMALKDAKHVLQDILERNVSDDELQLLQDGEPPYDAMPIFTFSIGVSWDREHMMAHYSQIGYGRCVNQKLFNPVYSLAMDLYEETFGILRARERRECKAKGGIRLKNDPVTEKMVRDQYEEWHRTSLTRWLARFKAHEANKKRFDCEFLRNGYCTPVHPECPCYKSGKCEEVKEVCDE